LIQIGNFELFEIRNGINGRSGADYQKIPGILWRQIPFRPSPRRRFSPFLRDPLHYHRLVANFWFPGFVFVYKSVIIYFVLACTFWHCWSFHSWYYLIDVTSLTRWVSDYFTTPSRMMERSRPWHLCCHTETSPRAYLETTRFIWDNSYSAF
jgi:hypothetical protein